MTKKTIQPLIGVIVMVPSVSNRCELELELKIFGSLLGQIPEVCMTKQLYLSFLPFTSFLFVSDLLSSDFIHPEMCSKTRYLCFSSLSLVFSLLLSFDSLYPSRSVFKGETEVFSSSFFFFPLVPSSQRCI